jgi:hypothetical protein
VNWKVDPEGRTFSNRPNGHFTIRNEEGVYVTVAAFQALATTRENRDRARKAAEDIVRLLNAPKGTPSERRALRERPNQDR